jgi:YD repeat-containing protein
VRVTDPEGNVDLYGYHPKNDPGGGGTGLTAGVGGGPFGYLREVLRDAVGGRLRNSATDPEPARIRTLFFYDAVGNVIWDLNGRGIWTFYSVNQLDQIVQITRAAGHAGDPAEPITPVDFQYVERYFYDANDNLVMQQVEDRGNTSNVDGNLLGGDIPRSAPDPDPAGGVAYVDTVFKFDILDNNVEMVEEAGAGEVLRTGFRYDRNENTVLVIQPVGNAAAYIHDERDLVFQHMRGTLFPRRLAHLAARDTATFDVVVGTPSTETYHYDGNRNLAELVDASDTDGSPENNSDAGGFGDRTRYIYEGFDRLASFVDSVGDQTVYQYDPAGNVVRVSRFGPAGGPSPSSDGPDLHGYPVSEAGVIQVDRLVDPTLLDASETRYDELGRAFQTDRPLFVIDGQTWRVPDLLDGAADIGKGDLTPGDDVSIPGLPAVPIVGRVSARTEFDRSSRPRFYVEDDGDTTAVFYDGAGRAIAVVDPEGNVVETAYDANDNVIEVRETDVAQMPRLPDERFLATYLYDSLDRLQRRVDNIGQTIYYRYDSRSNTVVVADALGPMPGGSVTRRSFAAGAATVDETNEPGNVTRYAYDGLGRMVREELVLTPSGEGTGSIGTDIFGVPAPGVVPDPTQAGGDGLITMLYEWDANSRRTGFTDDNGNQTLYTYDDLDRLRSVTKGVCVAPNLAGQCDEPTSIFYVLDPDDNLVRMVDQSGSLMDCRFDGINRLVSCEVVRAPGVVGTTLVSRQYDGLSRITQATDNNDPVASDDDSVVTYAYDSLGRVIEETQRTGTQLPRVVSST